MGMATSLITGERGVVCLFLGCILYSLPLSLLPHGVALSFLALSAFLLEILLESSPLFLSVFKTRPGASSGLLLGAVTSPGVMLSKLIQLLRGLSSNEIGLHELDYVAMQYWATSASSFGVLIFLLIVSWHSKITPNSHTLWGSKTGLGWFAFCTLLLILSYTGLLTSFKLLWMIFHGFAAVQLMQHLLNTFPSCASIGEALLVTAGLVLYFGDMLACTIAKFLRLVGLSELVIQHFEIRRTEITVIIQGVLLGLLLLPILFKFLVWLWDCFSSTTNHVVRTHDEKWKSLIFAASLGFIMTAFIPSWMQFIQDFQVHPFLWVVMFVFSEPVKRLSLCIYWVCVICVAVQRFYNISKNSKIERILLRKYYHLMAVLMFLPAVIFQPKFLDLAFGAALAVFLILEIIRVWRIWPLGHLVHQFMNAFTDHRDSDLLIVSHFSLLLGCALPIWMSSGYNDRPLAPFAGILSLGIGDTMASMVGHKYGVLRWSKTGKKTIEGTAAGITSVLAACSVLLPLLASTGHIFTQHWVLLLLAVVVSGLLEAYTAQLDNAFIPLVFYGLLCL